MTYIIITSENNEEYVNDAGVYIQDHNLQALVFDPSNLLTKAVYTGGSSDIEAQKWCQYRGLEDVPVLTEEEALEWMSPVVFALHVFLDEDIEDNKIYRISATNERTGEVLLHRHSFPPEDRTRAGDMMFDIERSGRTKWGHLKAPLWGTEGDFISQG